MIKKLAFILLCVFTLSAFFGCTEDAPPDVEDPNALVIMGKKTDMEKTYMKKIFDLYKKKTGKGLRIVEIEDSVYESAAADKFDKGEKPDIFFHFNNSDLNRFNVSENFYYLDDQPWTDDLAKGADNYCRDGEGHLLGLPFWESSVSGCYYNKTLFKTIGANPAYTQAQFDSLCQFIARRNITPICWPGDGCSWMYQFALDPVFADEPDGPALLAALNAGETSYADIPAVTAMAEWIVGAKDKGWFGSDYATVGWDRISEKLSSGNAAMVFIWDTWFYTDFVEGKYKKEDFALMPVFMGTEDEGTYEGGNINMMMANKNSDKLAEALDFIAFCATPEHYNYAFENISTVSCFKGQTTNIQSHMITDKYTAESIAAKERVSTASTRIIGYSADNVAAIFNRLLAGEINVKQTIEQLDADRLAVKRAEGR